MYSLLSLALFYYLSHLITFFNIFHKCFSWVWKTALKFRYTLLEIRSHCLNSTCCSTVLNNIMLSQSNYQKVDFPVYEFDCSAIFCVLKI